MPYKVVKENRTSCTVGSPKYSLTYEKDSVVKAIPNTLGIFTFETELHAYTFIKRYIYAPGTLVLKVEGIGKAKYPQKIPYPFDIEDFYTNKDYECHSVPGGTVCYPEVKVLE